MKQRSVRCPLRYQLRALPWGNLTSLGPNATTQPNYVGCTQESGFNYTSAGQITTKNQIAAYCYDAAGNLVLETTCPTGTFTPAFQYDAENHLVSTAGVNYTYDGRGSGFVLANPELKTASA
jgi:YD repeat-containing protein